MLNVYALKLNTSWIEKQFSKLLLFISNEKIERVNRFYRFQDAQRVLMGDLLVRYLLCKKLNIRNHELKFGCNSYGKPFLIHDNSLQFNISHSGNWVVCCIDDKPVGIDVEKIQKIDMNIAERFFSNEEVSDLKQKSDTEKLQYFFELWTLKESYIKAVGKGLSIPLNSFSIKFGNISNISVTSKLDPDDFYFKQFDLDKEYKMAVCTKKEKIPDEVQIIDIEILYEFLSIHE